MRAHTSARGARTTCDASTTTFLEPEEGLDALGEEREEMLKVGRDRDRGDDRRYPRPGEGEQGADAHARPEEARHAPGVDEDVADLEPGQERRGHPGPVALEELGQVEAGA